MDTTQETLKLATSIEVTDSKTRRELLQFCYSACRIDGECLGWLPKAAYDQAHQQGRIIALWNNDDLVGFALWSCDCGQLRCLQVWVRRDARLMLHGKAIVSRLDAIARARNCYRLRLWCAIDLAANHFWNALGFRYGGWRWGRAKNSRKHALWLRPIHDWPLPPPPQSNEPRRPELSFPTSPTCHQGQAPEARTTSQQLPKPTAAPPHFLKAAHHEKADPQPEPLSRANGWP